MQLAENLMVCWSVDNQMIGGGSVARASPSLPYFLARVQLTNHTTPAHSRRYLDINNNNIKSLAKPYHTYY